MDKTCNKHNEIKSMLKIVKLHPEGVVDINVTILALYFVDDPRLIDLEFHMDQITYYVSVNSPFLMVCG